MKTPSKHICDNRCLNDNDGHHSWPAPRANECICGQYMGRDIYCPKCEDKSKIMKQKTVYQISGTTGEYEDQQNWVVATYFDEDNARKHLKDIQDWYIANGGKSICQLPMSKLKKNPYDPGMVVDYTGTRWSIEAIKIYNSISEFKKEHSNE